MATRSIGAKRWMYRPFCRRSGRNSSSDSFAGQVAAGLVAELGDPLITGKAPRQKRHFGGEITRHGRLTCCSGHDTISAR
jgi:hypothetical protein